MHRFYYPGSLSVPEVELTGDEANHLTRVLRLCLGDRVELFDGQGQALTAEVVATQKKSVTIRMVSDSPVLPPRTPTLTLLTASPKSERLRWLVEKATELGVDRLTLLRTQHSVVHPGPGKLRKMDAAVIAACKQSGRNDLMPIEPPQPWESAATQAVQDADRLLIATPDGQPIEEQQAEMGNPSSIAVAIGPEGGWTAEEITFAVDRGAVPVRLGSLILRTETACLAAASILRSQYATQA